MRQQLYYTYMYVIMFKYLIKYDDNTEIIMAIKSFKNVFYCNTTILLDLKQKIFCRTCVFIQR